MTQILDGAAYLKIDQAAERLGTTVPAILMLLKRDALKGVESDGEWFVSADSIACFKAHGTDMKDAMGCRSYCSATGCGCK